MKGATAAITFLLLCLSAGFVALGALMTFRLTPERTQRQILRWLAEWFGKGVVLPVALWAVMNLGLTWNLPAFMPSVQAAQINGFSWIGEWLRVTALGGFVVTSFWSTATLGWVLATTCSAVDVEARQHFKALCWTCAIGLGIPALLVLLVGGWEALGLAGAIVLGPMAGYAPGILTPRKAPPLYARAIARIKFGKYAEAEMEIIRELEKCEDDFEGWMMLAELYATRFSDIAEAERAVIELCDQPKLTPSQLSVALHRLADWQLKVAGDPDAARRALRILIDRLPGTHLAHMARLRLNQLPRTVQELQEQRAGTRIPLPALGDKLDRPTDSDLPPMERKQAARQANACVEQLKNDPNNVSAREKLARLFSEYLDRADLGIEQLHLLLDMAEQPDNKRAEWLGLTAAWHLKYRDDPAAACRFLERLIDEFPGSPHAIGARRRLEQAKARLT
ncbi:MAG TPA: tetratricopeptide repeat protein [Verrucomicrobiae bacterium]